MKGKVCAFFLAVVSFISVAQDNQYSQFYANKLYLNPAFAGTEICPRIILGFRDQWPGLAGEYVSYSASYDQSVNNTGIGVIFNGDDAGKGVLKTNTISAIISPKVQLTNAYTLSFAVSVGLIQKKLDHSTLVFPNQITPDGPNSFPQEINSDVSKITPDISTGILLYSSDIYMGYSIHHVLQPNNILLGPAGLLYRRHTMHLGTNISLPKSLGTRKKDIAKLAPQIVFQKQGPHTEMNFGMYFSKSKFTTGLWYRGDDALILVVGVQANKYSFGFSYDATISKLSDQSLGALEISASYKFNCVSRSKNINRIDCPSF